VQTVPSNTGGAKPPVRGRSCEHMRRAPARALQGATYVHLPGAATTTASAVMPPTDATTRIASLFPHIHLLSIRTSSVFAALCRTRASV